MVYVLKVGTHSTLSIRRKFDVRILVSLKGRGELMLVRAMHVMCLETVSSGCVRVLPHMVVEYVDMVTERESRVHCPSPSFSGSFLFFRVSESGMCWPGAIDSGCERHGTTWGCLLEELRERTLVTDVRETSLSFEGFQT